MESHSLPLTMLLEVLLSCSTAWFSLDLTVLKISIFTGVGSFGPLKIMFIIKQGKTKFQVECNCNVFQTIKCIEQNSAGVTYLQNHLQYLKYCTKK
jgi:hypothetical protein